jgi:3-oxoacyl-[acyl-carrier protein] reductase
MQTELAGKVVCITGGSRGIGLSTAQAFAAEEAKVVICGRDPGNLKTAAEQIRSATGRSIDAIQADVTRVADIDRLMAQIGATHGRIDVLVNNAGTGIYKAFSDVTDEELLSGMSINFFAQFRVTQRALPLLRKSDAGSVINVSGRTAMRGNFPPGTSCTGPAKAAEVRFSIDLASELAEWRIRVNAVMPGVIETPDRFKLWESQALKMNLDASMAEEVRRRLERSVSGGKRWRLGQPEDIANVIVFLASPLAAYVNGVALMVDGGPHIKSYVSELYTQQAAIIQELAEKNSKQ